MTHLNLVKSDGQTEPIPDPRRHLIKLWRDYYKDKRGMEPALTWGAMMNMMLHTFEVSDEKTGELFIEYPEEETWLREIEGFFASRFAFDKNFSFAIFLAKKCYGAWGMPSKKPVGQLMGGLTKQFDGKPIASPNPWTCPNCHKVHSPNFQCAPRP